MSLAMSSSRWLLLAATLGAASLGVLARPKDVVAHIQCAVCKQAVKEASQRAKEKNIEDEDELIDLVDNLCSGTKDEGKWTTKIDIFKREQDGTAQLALDHRVDEGVCQSECKSIQKACTVGLKGREESLVSLVKERAGVGKLQREVCTKSCKKAVPALGQWKDEAFQPSAPKPPPMPPPPEPPPPSPPAEPADPVKEFAPIMSDVVSAALAEYGAAATLQDDVKVCFNGTASVGASQRFLADTKTGTEEMLKKELDGMRSGLGRLGDAFARLGEAVQEACIESAAIGNIAAEMRTSGERMAANCKDTSVSVEYKPMETLKVDGHDMHKLLNSFLGKWKQEPADGKAFGTALANLFKALKTESKSEL